MIVNVNLITHIIDDVLIFIRGPCYEICAAVHSASVMVNKGEVKFEPRLKPISQTKLDSRNGGHGFLMMVLQ